MQIVRLLWRLSERWGARPENNTVVSQMIISSNNSLAWHVLLSLSFLRSFLIFPLPFGFSRSLSLPDRFASSPTQWVYVMLFYFSIFFSATPLFCLSLADVNHKMVDQRLFPAQPLPVWVGLAEDFIPLFSLIRSKIRALSFSLVPPHTRLTGESGSSQHQLHARSPRPGCCREKFLQ